MTLLLNFIFLAVIFDLCSSHPPNSQSQFYGYGGYGYGSIPSQIHSIRNGYGYNVRIPGSHPHGVFTPYSTFQFGNNWRNHNRYYPPGFAYGHGNPHYKYSYHHHHPHVHQHFDYDDDELTPTTPIDQNNETSEEQNEEFSREVTTIPTTTSTEENSSDGDPFAIDIRFMSNSTTTVATVKNDTASTEDRGKRSTTNSIDMDIVPTEPIVKERSFNTLYPFYPSFFWHTPNFQRPSITNEDFDDDDNSLATCVQPRYECVPLSECVGANNQDIRRRQRRYCRRGTEGEVHVCCEAKNLPSPAGTSFTRQDIACGRKAILSGGAKSAAVLGGSPVSGASSYPWMVAIGQVGSGITSVKGGIDWFCGGALISQQTVLTAAHCLSRRRADLVRVGETDLTKSGSSTAQIVRVWRTYSHPSHRAPAMYNDLALVYLSKPVLLNQHVRPVCLPRSPIGKAVAILTGWGQTDFEGERSNVLREVQVQVFNNTECDKMYGASGVVIKRSFPRGILDTQMCAGHEQGGRDACQGDSGSPLVTEEDSNFVLSGIVSAGIGCGSKQFPGIYTRVTSYVPWIIENLI